jgi:hypothetical protein
MGLRDRRRSALDRGDVPVVWRNDRRVLFPDECVACGAPSTGTYAIGRQTELRWFVGANKTRTASIWYEIRGVGHCNDHAPPKIKNGFAEASLTKTGSPGIKGTTFGATLSGDVLTGHVLTFCFARPEFAKRFATANIELVVEALSTSFEKKARDVLAELGHPAAQAEQVPEKPEKRRPPLTRTRPIQKGDFSELSELLAHDDWHIRGLALNSVRIAVMKGKNHPSDPSLLAARDAIAALARDDPSEKVRTDAGKLLEQLQR